MKNSFIAILFFISLFLCSSCNNELEDGGFMVELKQNMSNKIRLDGYYYHDTGHGIITYVFFGDGQVIDGGISWDSLPAIEHDIVDGSFSDRISGNVMWWGRYAINGTNIVMEFPFISLYTHLSYGKILNDKTLYFSEFENLENKTFGSINVTLHFKAFNQKPDSTNICTYF